ncbi:MAG: hypothetical protein AAFN94_00925 [Pseudomonadota bacterium]
MPTEATNEQCVTAMDVIESAPEIYASELCGAALARAFDKGELDALAASLEAENPDLFDAICDAFQAYN